MPDSKITALASTGTGTDPANDPLVIVDVSDTSMAATGTTKKVTLNNLLACSPTATLASATITGDLTVDTSTLKVDSSNDRVGIGTATPAAKLIVRDGSNRNLLVSSDASQLGSAGVAIGSFTDNAAGYAPLSIIAGTSIAFGLNGTTAMTLNATGLGIGTTPAYKFHIGTSQASETAIYVDNQANNAAAASALTLSAYGGSWNISVPHSATSVNPLIFKFGSTERMRIDSTGNVGIGVTPSAWRSNYRAIEIARAGSGFWSQTDSSRVGMSANTYFNSSSQFIYSDTSAATYYNQVSGQHQWFNAPSGTAGSAITFTQAMTLDASGNLLLGVASSSNRLDIQKSTDCAILVKSTGANTNIAMDYVTNYGNHTIRKSGTAVWDFGVINDSSATPAFKFSNGTDRLIIDASGRLLVGTTVLNASWDTRLTLSSDVGTTRWAVGPYVAPQNFVISAGAGTGVYLNGTAATSWTSLSDERLKDIIEPISNAVSKVASLRAVIGKFKFDENNTRKPFLIAQDIQAVLPEAVDASNPDKLGVAYTDVIPLLVAAIKELTARVQTLEAK